jgi:transcriptional regulator with GAF, ATPase, and Fis domain
VPTGWHWRDPSLTTASPVFDADDDALEGQVRFETFLADTAARFLDLPPEQLDVAIEQSLEGVVRTLGVDRGALAQFADEGRSLRWTHGFAVSDVAWPDLQADIAQALPWYAQQFRERRTLVLPRALEGVPADARLERERIAATGLKSLLSVPLEAGSDVLGAMSLLVYSEFRDWDPAIVSRLELLAGIFANALYRQGARARLRRAAELSRAVLASVESEIVVLDRGGHVVAVNEAWMHSRRRDGVPTAGLADGSDYLSAAQRAQDQGQIDAREALAGFRAVLSGEVPDLQTSYSYFSPTGQRVHYVVTMTPRIAGDGFVIVHTDVTELAETKSALETSLREVTELKERLEAENVVLRQEVRRSHGFDEIVGTSLALGRMLAQVEQVAPTDVPVLLLGETGTGKDLVARALHDRSLRRERPFVIVNCAALPATLVESELFGHEKGAFTGAVQRTIGRFEVAHGGTLFLDEIGELPPEVQAKLLRVLQTGEFERLGSAKTTRVDVRLIAATNRDLEREVREGRFRADLFYRLSVFPISLPPLRERSEDIPLLVWHFIGRRQAGLGRSVKRVPERLMRAFAAYAWPGNVRELENLVDRALIMTTGETLAADPAFLEAAPVKPPVGPQASLAEAERAHIRAVLDECGWRISGKGNAAERLGLKRSTLQVRMKKLGLARPGSGV